MDLLLLIGFGLFMLGKKIYDECTKSKHVFTSEELDSMCGEMVGKSTKECQQILKKYRE